MIIDQIGDIRCLADLVEGIEGEIVKPETLHALSCTDTSRLPLIDQNTRIGPCVGSVGKFICIGLNYADHAAESGMPIPTEPEVFTKATSAICGPNDDIIQPKNSDKLDWEVELALVIAKKASYVSEEEAMD